MPVYFLIALAVLFADLASKMAVSNGMALGDSLPLIPGVLHITHVANSGMAFGLLADARWVFIASSCVMIAFAVWFLARDRGYARCVPLCAALILGGGAANLVDRVCVLGKNDLTGSVVDFIDFCALPQVWQWTFNVADSAVCVGAAILAVYLLFFDKKAAENGKKPLLFDPKESKKP